MPCASRNFEDVKPNPINTGTLKPPLGPWSHAASRTCLYELRDHRRLCHGAAGNFGILLRVTESNEGQSF